jgi:hypothetical protein
MPLRKPSKPRVDDESDYVEPLYYKKRGRRERMPNKTIVIIIGVIIFVLAVGGGYFALKGNKTKKPTSHSSSAVNIPVTTPSVAATSTPQYVSNGKDLNLTFSYPSTWTVSPQSNDNSSDGTITLTSPLSSIPAASGASATGKVVVEVRAGNSSINELNVYSPVEAIASSQIAYAAPTAAQYAYPFLSYFHFTNGNSKTAGVFEEVMITGGQSFTASESLNASYLSGLDPIISASFYECTTTACTGSGQTPLSITATTWQNSSIFEQVLNLFESFKLN